MLLVIDNYDSFVYNLARYVRELGKECVVKRNDKITLEEIELEIKPSHIILSPGPCTPDEAGICLDVVKSLGDRIPMLGVCLGHQVIGQALGGTISQAHQPMHGKATLLRHDGRGIFAGIPNPVSVGRYHSLVVDSADLPKDIRINAIHNEDIMAIEHVAKPLYGLQFHIESVMTDHGHDFLKNFLQVSSC